MNRFSCKKILLLLAYLLPAMTYHCAFSMIPRPQVTIKNNSLIPLLLTIVKSDGNIQEITLGPSRSLWGMQYISKIPKVGQAITTLLGQMGQAITNPDKHTIMNLNSIQAASFKPASIQLLRNLASITPVTTQPMALPIKQIKDGQYENSEIQISLDWTIRHPSTFKEALQYGSFKIDTYIPGTGWFGWFKGQWLAKEAPVQPAEVMRGVEQPPIEGLEEEFEMIIVPSEDVVLEQGIDNLIMQLNQVLQIQENYYDLRNQLAAERSKEKIDDLQKQLTEAEKKWHDTLKAKSTTNLVTKANSQTQELSDKIYKLSEKLTDKRHRELIIKANALKELLVLVQRATGLLPGKIIEEYEPTSP